MQKMRKDRLCQPAAPRILRLHEGHAFGQSSLRLACVLRIMEGVMMNLKPDPAKSDEITLDGSPVPYRRENGIARITALRDT